MALPWMPAKSYGGKLNASIVVIHCTESDNGPGTAESLAGPNWFGGPAGTSAHKMFDRNSGVEMVKRSVVAYHAGPKGNSAGVSYEFCGRASWTAAKWREPEQLNMLRLAAPHIADDLRAIGASARWLSLVQLASGQRGMCTHNDIRLALSGTTHSDPGPNFPYSELLTYVQAALNGTALEDDDMPYTPDQIKQMVREAVLDTDLIGNTSLSEFVGLNSRVLDDKGQPKAIFQQVLDVDLGGGSLSDYIRAERVSPDSDPQKLAEAIALLLPRENAQVVADELAARLAS